MLNLSYRNREAISSPTPWPVDFVRMTITDKPLGTCSDGRLGISEELCTTGTTEYPNNNTWVKTDDNGNIFITNHFSNITIDGDTYIAAGEFLNFSDIADNLDVKDNTLDISLSGVEATLTAVVLGNPIEGSIVEVSRGFFDDQSGKLYGDTGVLPQEQKSLEIDFATLGSNNNNRIEIENITIGNVYSGGVSSDSVTEIWFRHSSDKHTFFQFRSFIGNDNATNLVDSVANFATNWNDHAVTALGTVNYVASVKTTNNEILILTPTSVVGNAGWTGNETKVEAGGTAAFTFVDKTILIDSPEEIQSIYTRWMGSVNNYSIVDDYNFTDEDKITISISCKSTLTTLLARVAGRFTSPQGYNLGLQSRDVTSVSSGQIYRIVLLAGTTQAQWNTVAGTTGVTYVGGDQFTASGLSAGSGKVELVELSMEFVPSLPTFNPSFGNQE